MKKYNFNAGPSKLPREVMEATAAACIEFEGSGLSLMEMSHRAKNFQPVVDEAVALFRELLDIPEGYSVLFLGGGASLEFCMVPYNFLEHKAAYLNTGVWAKKAMAEAKLFGHVTDAASRFTAPTRFSSKRICQTKVGQPPRPRTTLSSTPPSETTDSCRNLPFSKKRHTTTSITRRTTTFHT